MAEIDALLDKAFKVIDSKDDGMIELLKESLTKKQFEICLALYMARVILNSRNSTGMLKYQYSQKIVRNIRLIMTGMDPQLKEISINFDKVGTLNVNTITENTLSHILYFHIKSLPEYDLTFNEMEEKCLDEKYVYEGIICGDKTSMRVLVTNYEYHNFGNIKETRPGNFYMKGKDGTYGHPILTLDVFKANYKGHKEFCFRKLI